MDEKLIEAKFNIVGERIDNCSQRIARIEEQWIESDKKNAILSERIMQFIESQSETNKDVKDTLRQQTEFNKKMEIYLSTDQMKKENMQADICSLKKKTAEIDEEGKFNWRRFVSNNWLKIIIGVCALTAAVKVWIW